MTDTIVEASRIAEAARAKFILLLIPSKEQSYWHIINENLGDLNRYDLDAVNRALMQFCRENKITWIDLTPFFREEANRNKQLYFRLDGHWNAEGHRLAARAIYDYLVKHRSLEMAPQKGSVKN